MARGKIGVALGGGVARGWSHIGVLKALEKSGFKPDIVAGTSIGAVAGGCYVAGKLDELEVFARSLTRRRVFGFLDFNMSGSGLISGDKLGDRIASHLGDTQIETLDRRFVAVATEIGTGHEIWLSRGHLVDAMRASYALPGIFRPVKLGGRWLFDGAIVNPIPVSVCRAMGANIVIAVNLQSDSLGRGAVLSDQRTLEEIETDGLDGSMVEQQKGGGALKLLHRQFFGRGSDAPGISTVMMEAFNITQDRIARSRLAGDPPDFTISPKLAHIGTFDFHRADELIAIGEAAAERALAEIRAELSPAQTHAHAHVS
ncbi:MAG: patatin-like phospholipase family protein [Hyphomicrobiaceae bacterium]